MQGGVDHDGNVNARFNQGWSQTNVSKVQAQVRFCNLIVRRAGSNELHSFHKPLATI